MVISATRSEMEAWMAPANVSVITTDNTENRLVQRLGDSLKDIPGIYLRGGAYGTHFPGSSTSYSSFHGVGGTNRSLYLMDGLPVNTPNNGNVDWNMLNMDDAQQVEYVPGPFSALYGSGAMGGVLNVISKVPTKREGKLTVGAGGAAVDQWGIKGRYRDRFENGLGISLTFNHMESDNWAVSDYVTLNRGGNALNGGSIPVIGAIPTTNNTGQTAQYIIGDKGRRPWEQNNASLHLYYDLSPQTQIDGGMGWSRGETNDNGSFNSYLTRLDGTPISIGSGSSNINIDGRRYAVTENSFMHFLPGIEDTRRYFAHLKHDFGSDIKLNVDFQYMQTETSSTSPGTSATLNGGAGTITLTPSNRIDGNVSLRFPFLWNERNFVTVGFGSSQTTLEGQSRYNLSNWRNSDSTTTLTALSKGESSIYSAYIQDELWLRKNLIAHLGVRYDDWSTSGSNMNASTAFNRNYQEHSVGQFNPKFSLTWLPADGYKLFASTGWAFRPPTNFELYGSSITSAVITEPNANLEPEKMYSWEVGGEANPFEGTTIAASYYHHYISDLIYNKTISLPSANPRLAEKQNAGAAEVEGVEVKLRQRLYWDWLHFNGTYTLNDSVITENTADPAIVGKQMQQLPQTMFSGGLDIKYDKWSGGIIGRYVSQPTFNDLNTDSATGRPGSYDPYFLVDARMAFQATQNIDVSFSVNNLLDREYSQFYLQAGRSVYGEISYSF
ncbi:MAG: TonB-dependent receptor [Methylomonas sp.]|nr:TonB-dependent receptor [Methylomonas sp.]